MVIEKNNTELRHEKLMEAFHDKGFYDELKKVCKQIKNVIENLLGTLDRFDSRIDNVFSIQARVKGETNFEEKLYRKNYIREWAVTDNIEENKALIRKELTDLIGVRVNCYFVENEEKLYRFFENHAKELDGFTFNFKENKKQKNNHIIYKFSGIYQETYRFEIQIKSIVHNVWGEVDHKVIYKNPVYDSFIDKKKEISDSLYNVLFASDSQLCSIFRMQETEEQLIRSLYFCYTNDEVMGPCKTHVLAGHYENYFRSFEDISDIKQYVICKMSNQVYTKTDARKVDREKYEELKAEVERVFPQFYLECLFYIDSCMHIHEDFDSFVYYFLDSIAGNFFKDDDDEFDGGFGGDEEKNNESHKPLNDLLRLINSVLGKCISEDELEELLNHGAN